MSNPILQPEEHANENRPAPAPQQSDTRPFDVVPLPSKGLLYKEGPLAGLEAIEVYYLTAKEEDILTAPNLLRSGKVMDHLLKAVIINKKIDPAQLLLGDRNAILVWLRSTGYGKEYPVPLSCKHCGKTFAYEFDLAELDVRFLDTEPDADGLFAIDLPVSQKTARIKLLTAADDERVDSAVDSRARKLGGTGNPMTMRLFEHIVEIIGLDATETRKLIETMPVKDTRTIRKFIAGIEPSVIMRQDATCTQCGELNEEVVIPITPSFFWPDI
jgi:hypothetical protein